MNRKWSVWQLTILYMVSKIMHLYSEQSLSHLVQCSIFKHKKILPRRIRQNVSQWKFFKKKGGGGELLSRIPMAGSTDHQVGTTALDYQRTPPPPPQTSPRFERKKMGWGRVGRGVARARALLCIMKFVTLLDFSFFLTRCLWPASSHSTPSSFILSTASLLSSMLIKVRV